MKILLINGSPKGENSNSLKLAKAFCSGISEETDTSIEIIPVYKLNIRECIGCFHCWKTTPGKCCLKDDMSEMIEKIISSDIIVWSFPLYYFSVPSKLKAFMDRQLPMNLPFMLPDKESGGHPSRYDLSGKKYVVISTCGFYTAKGNYMAIDSQFGHMYEDNYTSIYCGQGELFNIPPLRERTDEYLSYVKKAGSEYIKGSISAETKKLLNELLYPRNVYEEMADASWGIEKEQKENSQDKQALTFTKQMSALYNKSSWKGKDIVLEFYYTDIDERYQLVMKKDGIEVLSEHFLEITTKIETPFSLWQKIGKGEVDGQKALMDRLYKISGDFKVMIHWNDYFGHKKTSSPKAEDKKTNLSILLFSWISIWIFLSIDAKLGGIIGILTGSLLPFSYVKYKHTIFECISFFIVTSISLLSILGYSISVLLPISYLLFGIMWTATVFQKIPLTAYYSINDFDEDMIKNPLFIKTNKILTLCWGLLYILTPIWTYMLLQTPMKAFVGLINSVLPLVMGVFTKWFKDWYPQYYAGK